mgnify:CR=1 FL=1
MNPTVFPHRARLGVGTGQFAEPRGRGGEAEIRAILDTAAPAGVTLIDTAAAYGDAERALGRSWPFPSPFSVVTRTVRLSEGLDRIEHRARRSLERLGIARGEGLLVHAAEDLHGPDGPDLWARLQRLKADGLFQKIGFSAHGDDQPVALARRYQPDLVQLPVSMLDQRLVVDGTLERLAEQGVEVHLRSVFLKGLLFMDREALPACLNHAGPRLSRIRRMLAEAGADPLQAALTFALDRPEASAVVVGVASAAELRAVIAASYQPSPRLDWSALSLDDTTALDPRLWVSTAA